MDKYYPGWAPAMNAAEKERRGLSPRKREFWKWMFGRPSLKPKERIKSWTDAGYVVGDDGDVYFPNGPPDDPGTVLQHYGVIPGSKAWERETARRRGDEPEPRAPRSPLNDLAEPLALSPVRPDTQPTPAQREGAVRPMFYSPEASPPVSEESRPLSPDSPPPSQNSGSFEWDPEEMATPEGTTACGMCDDAAVVSGAYRQYRWFLSAASERRGFKPCTPSECRAYVLNVSAALGPSELRRFICDFERTVAAESRCNAADILILRGLLAEAAAI